MIPKEMFYEINKAFIKSLNKVDQDDKIMKRNEYMNPTIWMRPITSKYVKVDYDIDKGE